MTIRPQHAHIERVINGWIVDIDTNDDRWVYNTLKVAVQKMVGELMGCSDPDAYLVTIKRVSPDEPIGYPVGID